MRDPKYYFKEKSLYADIIRMLHFISSGSSRLFAADNNLVYSRISAFIKHVYICYARNYENNLDQRRRLPYQSYCHQKAFDLVGAFALK